MATGVVVPRIIRIENYSNKHTSDIFSLTKFIFVWSSFTIKISIVLNNHSDVIYFKMKGKIKSLVNEMVASFFSPKTLCFCISMRCLQIINQGQVIRTKTHFLSGYMPSTDCLRSMTVRKIWLNIRSLTNVDESLYLSNYLNNHLSISGLYCSMKNISLLSISKLRNKKLVING